MTQRGRPFGSYKNRHWLTDPLYSPNRLLNRLLQELEFESDRELAVALGCVPTLIGRIRRKKQVISAGVVIGIMELTGWPLADVRALGGIPKSVRNEEKE